MKFPSQFPTHRHATTFGWDGGQLAMLAAPSANGLTSPSTSIVVGLESTVGVAVAKYHEGHAYV
jgi:hypothetical protein